MNHLKILTAALLLAAAVPASACSPPVWQEVFFSDADRNEDGKISLREWLHFKTPPGYEVFVQLDTANFRRLDSNRNGKLERKEIYSYQGEKVMLGYIDDPCEGIYSDPIK